MKARGGDPVFTPPQVGEFCWEQLCSHDLPNAREFYAEVIGWKTMGMGGGDLEMFGFGHQQSEQAATLATATPEVGSGWLSFIVVDSLGAACERTVQLGGKVLSEHTVVPGVGNYAVIQDPQGARLGLFK